GDLVAPREDGHAHGGADDERRDDGERAAQDRGRGAGDAAQQEDLVEPVLAVHHLFDDRVGGDPVGDVAHGPRIPEAGVESHGEGGGQRVDIELHHHRVELAELLPGDLKGLFAGDVDDVEHLRVHGDLVAYQLDGVGPRVVPQVRDDLDPLLDPLQHPVDVVRRNAEQTDHEERE